MKRLLWLQAFSVVCVLIFCASHASADVKPSPEIDASVARGLAYLSKLQKPDGSITDGPHPVAMTGLSLLAYLSAGHTQDAGKQGLAVRSAVDFLLKVVPKDGYAGAVDGSRMYGHGIVTLALAEAYGVETDLKRRELMRETLARMIDVILKAQSVQKDDASQGGWRYEPGSNDSDLSLSGWCALALRASQNVGMNVAKDPIDRAVGYVARCYKPDEAAFSYQPGQAASIAMTSVAILNLYLLDAANRDEVKRATEWLAKQQVNAETRFFHYTIYYSTQAAFQAGGEIEEQIWKSTKKNLLSRQQEDGGFSQSPDAQEPGRAFATAISVMTLAIPFETLPIYQK